MKIIEILTVMGQMKLNLNPTKMNLIYMKILQYITKEKKSNGLF